MSGKSRAPYALGGLLLSAIIACSNLMGPDEVVVEMATDRTRYALGDEAVLTLHNSGAEVLIRHGGNLCGWGLVERRTEGEWVDRRMVESLCTAIRITTRVHEGDVVEKPIGLTERVFEVGEEYRFIAGVIDDEGTPHAVASNSFTVER